MNRIDCRLRPERGALMSSMAASVVVEAFVVTVPQPVEREGDVRDEWRGN